MQKSTISLSIVLILLCTAIFAQKGEFTFNFYGQDAATLNSVSLEKVVVKNLTQNCDTTLYGPDPKLVLWVSGINEFKKQDFIVGNNYPNPFSGTTSFDLQLEKPEQIAIRLLNIQGAVVAEYKNLFQTGTHSMKITTGRAGIYYAEVSTTNTTRTIKLVSNSSSSVNNFNITYDGTNADSQLKQSLQTLGFVFQPGDELEITASAETYPDEILTASPSSDMDFTFDMRPVPIANFEVSSALGVFPFITAFTDLSQRNPTTWYWDFGDGLSGTSQNITHNFANSGLYTVYLVVGNEWGNDTLVMEDFIEVKDVLIVSDTTNGYAPLLVNFIGVSKIPGISAWTWHFGDGETSNEQNPTHIYTIEDTYNYVTLTVLAGGEEYTDNITIQVLNDLAEVNFTADTTDGWVPQSIQFTSYTNISNPTGYNWSFGDGNHSYETNPVHTYDNIGTYTVSLQVADIGGYKTTTKEDYINIRFCPGAVQDADGNIYETVAIHKNCWMRENLNVGIRINGNVGFQTDNGIAEKYCYDYLEENCDEYGGLYQWDELMQYTIGDTTQGLCPDDWHVATKLEWNNLISYFGGSQIAGLYLKSHTGWENYGNGNNESGFTALPGGRFWEGNGEYEWIGEIASFWTSQSSGDAGIGIEIDYTHLALETSGGSYTGYSARCVKDNTMK